MGVFTKNEGAGKLGGVRQGGEVCLSEEGQTHPCRLPLSFGLMRLL
jgi:hypothetical protein